MSDIIKVLPDHIANQIAAGEVVQRPASVVKELMENAVDASATHIIVSVRQGGRQLIKVTDNGCGMSPTDARNCFLRHATSKISSAEDLFHLHTKGFRGRIRWSSRQCRKDVFVLIAGLRDWGVKSRCMLCSRAAAEYQESLHHSRNVWNVGTCLFRRVPRRLISTDRKRHRVRCLSRLLSGPECFCSLSCL